MLDAERDGPDRHTEHGAARPITVGLVVLLLAALVGSYLVWRGDSPPVTARGPGAVEAPLDDHAGRRAATPDDAPARALVADEQPDARDLAAVLEGLVRTPDGQPVAGADVVLVEVPDAGASGAGFLRPEALRPDRVRRAVSDALGRFEFERTDPTRPAWASAFREGLVGDRRWVPPQPDGEPADDLVLELEPGRTLRGRVSTVGGAALEGALVSVAQCWSSDDYADGSGFALTDESGEFSVGVDERSVACTLRVNADDLGQDLFVGVPVDVFADLRWHERASLRGRVAGMSVDRVGSVRVAVSGSLEDPPVPVFRTGWRPQLVFTAAVAWDGAYRVEGLQPGLGYEAFLVAVRPRTPASGADPTRASRRLSPATGDRFTPGPGEVVERDFALAAPIVVRGRVTTAVSRSPVAGARIEISRDGTTLWDAYAETDAEGVFEARLTAGAGAYRFHALPASSAGRRERPGVERQLSAGETVDVDLELAEPLVIPFRVVDLRGAGVESVQTKLAITTVDGRRASIGGSRRLDAEGRSRFELFEPVAAVRVVIQRFPRGPRSGVSISDPPPGTELPEQVIVLPDACDLTGVLQDAEGLPIAETSVTITATYDDGGADEMTISTGRDGRFAARGAFRAERMRVECRLPDRRAAAAAVPAMPAGTEADLGVLTVD